MDTREFLDAVGDQLDVTWLVISPREGNRIDVGEEFDVELSIRNKADSEGLLGFKDIELLIGSTSYAQPTGDSQFRVADRLGPGESINHVVRFRALHSDESTEGTFQQELIGDVRVRARFDVDRMSVIETKPRLLRAQIYGVGDPE